MDAFDADDTPAIHPFGGWALGKAAYLDLTHSRGLLADIASASLLKRQAAFVVLSIIDPTDPQPFLRRVGTGCESLGEVFRTHLARDLIAAAFEVEAVPNGYLRGLLRIGYGPLEEPGHYRRLFEILTQEATSGKAHALRYCGVPLLSGQIEAVDHLDPVLVQPEILKHVHGSRAVIKANALITFLRQVSGSATDEALAVLAKQAAGASALDWLAKRWIESKADRFPPPPFAATGMLKPLTSAAEMVEAAESMKNCLRTKIGEAVLGYACFYVGEVPLAGELVPVAAELKPLSNATWVVDGIYGVKNRTVPTPVMRAVVQELTGMGAVLAFNPRLHPLAKEIGSTLGVYRWGALESLELDQDQEEDDASEAEAQAA